MKQKRRCNIYYILYIIYIALAAVMLSYLNSIFVPKYLVDSTAIVDSFYAAEPDTVDVLFLGASQMFCGTRPEVLLKYGIEARNFGASNQPMDISVLYAKEALKTQKPKVIMLEICDLYWEFSSEDKATMSWNYDPLRFSFDKTRSLFSTFNGDIGKTIAYLLPLLNYHSRWSELEPYDFSYPFSDQIYSQRGFIEFSDCTEIELHYLDEDDSIPVVPQRNIAALSELSKLCKEKGIQLILYKVPTGAWTKNMLSGAKQTCDSLQLEYLDCFSVLPSIGIDTATDFRDNTHLNLSGANKVSEFLGYYLAGKL